MIYILTGNDIKTKNAYLKTVPKEGNSIFNVDSNVTKEVFFDYAGSVSLFGGSPTLIASNVVTSENIIFTVADLKILNESETTFIFLEDKLLVSESRKFEKFSTIKDFTIKAIKQGSKMNVFDIADAFSRRDKIGTWVLYRKAVSLGVSSEEISGIIFWKIKTMLLNGTKLFSINELKNRSSNLLSIYHKAHKGETDFVVGLEEFILLSLSKK